MQLSGRFKRVQAWLMQRDSLCHKRQFQRVPLLLNKQRDNLRWSIYLIIILLHSFRLTVPIPESPQQRKEVNASDAIVCTCPPSQALALTVHGHADTLKQKKLHKS
jgi:hypothetical protein